MKNISCHVLDTSLGRPGCNIKVKLYEILSDKRIEHLLAESKTNQEGRILSFEGKPISNSKVFKLVFYCEEYFKSLGTESFYPNIIIQFSQKNTKEHYHIPLLISPFGYSTYRGS